MSRNQMRDMWAMIGGRSLPPISESDKKMVQDIKMTWLLSKPAPKFPVGTTVWVNDDRRPYSGEVEEVTYWGGVLEYVICKPSSVWTRIERERDLRAI